MAGRYSLASRAKAGGRFRDRTCDLIHVKDALAPTEAGLRTPAISTAFYTINNCAIIFCSLARELAMLFKHKSVLFALVFAIGFIGQSLCVQGQGASQECNQTVMIEKILKDDLAGALTEVKPCVNQRKAVEARSSPSAGLSNNNMLEVITLGYFQLAQAQLEAATGDLRSAATHIADADATAQKWSGFYQSPITVTDWEGLLSVTRGFLLEKSGDLAGAKRLYAGHSPTSSNISLYGNIRLAEIALNEQRNDDALAIAQVMQASQPDSPHALIVLGALAEKRRDIGSAIADYQEALKRMQNIGNQFFPIYYFSSARAREGLARLK
jgi:tetratricopeptide (TPR) repeat protein